MYLISVQSVVLLFFTYEIKKVNFQNLKIGCQTTTATPHPPPPPPFLKKKKKSFMKKKENLFYGKKNKKTEGFLATGIKNKTGRASFLTAIFLIDRC